MLATVLIVLVAILVLVVVLILIFVVHCDFLLIYLIGLALASIPLLSGFILRPKKQTYKQTDHNSSSNPAGCCF